MHHSCAFVLASMPPPDGSLIVPPYMWTDPDTNLNSLVDVIANAIAMIEAGTPDEFFVGEAVYNSKRPGEEGTGHSVMYVLVREGNCWSLEAEESIIGA